MFSTTLILPQDDETIQANLIISDKISQEQNAPLGTYVLTRNLLPPSTNNPLLLLIRSVMSGTHYKIKFKHSHINILMMTNLKI